MNVYTMKEWQRHSIGMRIVSMLIDEARKRGVSEISLDATEEGRPLYTKPGFVPSAEGMVLVKEHNVKVEQIAGRYADTVCLGVGLCESYGTAQRMYVQRGYIPDGSGVWYQGRQCVQYETVCTVDDDLILFFSKKLRE